MSQSDFVTRGQALVAAGQYQEAVKVCRLGLLGRPTTVEGRVVLGAALLALKRFDEVLAEMRVALELDHNSVAAQVLKAEALLKKGDPDGACDVLKKARQQAPTDAKIAELLEAAEHAAGKASASAVHPSVGFVSPNSEPFTKHYPERSPSEFPGDEDSEGNYTRPTSLPLPQAIRPAPRPAGVPDRTPGPGILAVGDRSGTMEVDPSVDGVELGADDFGDVAAPPRGAGQSIEGARGSIQRAKPARAQPAAKKPKAGKKPSPEISTVELDDDEMIEVDTGEAQPAPKRIPSGPRSAVREAVRMPAGPLGDHPVGGRAQPPVVDLPRPSLASKRPTQVGPAVPVQPQLAQMIAQQPHVMQIDRALPTPFSATMPTAAAAPMPLPPMQAMPAVLNASARTIALSPAQQQSANAVDAMFRDPNAAPAWATSTVAAGPPQSVANEPTAKPAALDPHIQALLNTPDNPMLALGTEPASNSQARPLKTGVRKARSRMQIALWIFVGVLVIGGGVFAGFQIRSIRLRKEIDAERQKAVDAAKADTYAGWTQARNSLAGIVHASGTPENKAALARARAVLAYQFLDGFGDAKSAVDGLGATGGLDGAVAAAYVALAQSDPKAARAAADAAEKLAPSDAAVLYAMGQAQFLGGEFKAGIASLHAAVDAEPRASYQIGLAHAYGQVGQWDDAFGTVDKALAAMPDHPGALIERAWLLAESGRMTAQPTLAGEAKTKLEKLAAEAQKPIAEQTRGVSLGQAAYAELAISRADYALGKDTFTAANAALKLGVDDQPFVEAAVETFFATSDLANAQKIVERVLKKLPSSVRARFVSVELQLADGKPTDALDLLSKSAELMNLPKAQAVRGMARLANGDLELALQDFDAILKKAPSLELALIGRAYVMLARGDAEGARKVIEPHYNQNTASIPLATAYAAALRASGDGTALEKARALLERVVPTTTGIEIARAELELGRIYRDLGDPKKERAAYADAEKNGSRDAPIESAIALIEDVSDPSGGRDALNALYAKLDHPNARVVLETARGRTLMGDLAGATQLLESADKLPNVLRWQLDRERSRLALRRGDLNLAADAISRALDECGPDLETFVLAADVVSADIAAGGKHAPLAAKLKTTADRIKTTPEASIVDGKLALAARDLKAADTAYNKALTEMETQKASPRRRAQANFGLAAVYYYNGDDPNARDKLDLVIALDPSLYAAYAFYADILKDKDPRAALMKARKAVDLDPEFVEGWAELGELAGKLGEKKLLAEVISKLNEIAPDSEQLKELVQPKR